MSRIKRRSRVSTEAWRFDTKNVANEHRWLQWVDGENGWMGNGENGWIHEHMGQLFLDQGINGLYVGMLMMEKYRWNVITFKKSEMIYHYKVRKYLYYLENSVTFRSVCKRHVF